MDGDPTARFGRRAEAWGGASVRFTRDGGIGQNLGTVEVLTRLLGGVQSEVIGGFTFSQIDLGSERGGSLRATAGSGSVDPLIPFRGAAGRFAVIDGSLLIGGDQRGIRSL